MKTLYTETLGPATVAIMQYAKQLCVVTLDDSSIQQRDGSTFHNERAFHGPNALSHALDVYDHTCEYAAKRYNVERPLPEPPNFAATINL